MNRKPIRPRSKKMEMLYATKRRNLVKRLLAERPICQRCLSDRSQDIHELKSRSRGGKIVDDIDNLVALCRKCHTWVTQNPKQAHEQGWLKHSWE